MKKQNQSAIDLRMYHMAGIGRYLQNLLPDLIPRVNASKILILGELDDLASEEWSNDPRIKLCEYRPRIFSVAEQWAAACGKYHGIDLLWVPQYNIPLLYKGKLLVTIHDVCQLAHPETLGSDLQRWYARRLLSAVAARAESILCVSEFTSSEVQKYLGVKKSRMVVTYPPIGESAVCQDGVRPKFSEVPYLLTVGNVKKHKNLKQLITAFESVKDQIPHRLIVVGKQNGFLNSETELNGVSTLLNGRICFTGYVSEQELVSYYKHADAFILPSIYEGFGFPVLEAMAHGCPVACSNISSLPEVTGNAALLFDPLCIDEIAKAIKKLANNKNFREVLVKRGLIQVERFRGNGCAEKTAVVINSILANCQEECRWH
jgi:glycosyltransferase involved in cell wall biosynthesis